MSLTVLYVISKNVLLPALEINNWSKSQLQACYVTLKDLLKIVGICFGNCQECNFIT